MWKDLIISEVCILEVLLLADRKKIYMKKLIVWKLREHLEKQEGDCDVNEKKVVAVIVEGPSDENAIGGILKEFFSSEEVQFAFDF